MPQFRVGSPTPKLPECEIDTQRNESSTTAAGTLEPTGAAYARLELPAGTTLRFQVDAPCSVQLIDLQSGQLRVQKVDTDLPLQSPPGGTVLAIAATGHGPLHYELEATPCVPDGPPQTQQSPQPPVNSRPSGGAQPHRHHQSPNCELLTTRR